MAVSVLAQRLAGAARLGWQIEANWTDPAIFLIYRIARPLATALILAAMYAAVRGAASSEAAFAGFYLANAFHAFVDTVLIGMGWTVFEEREEYETLRYVYTSPMGLLTYLVGRSSVKFALATVSCAIVLAVGWVFVGVRWDWSAVQWLYLVPALALGLGATLALGLLLAGCALVLTRAAITVLEGMSLALYLACGVIFPIDLLPEPLRLMTLGLPFTWWYECLRRFLLGAPSRGFFADWSDPALLAGLAVSAAVFGLVARTGYFAFEHRARRLGRLDQTTLF